MNFTRALESMSALTSDAMHMPSVGLEAHSGKSDYLTINTAFKQATDNTSASLNMCKRVINYSKSIASRGENLTFFGGNLLGVDIIRFYDQDRDRWFDEVLQIDEAYLQELVHKVPAVNKDWKVAGNAFNLSVVWFIHRCFADLNPRDKQVHSAMVEALVMLQFKLLSSLYSHYFEKPVDKEAAEAVYSDLSMKFAIKRLGSWGEVLRWRAEAFLAKESTHHRDIVKFDNDAGSMYVLTDISTRIRKSIKDQYKTLERVRSGNLRIETTSNTIVLDGDKIIRDQVNSFNTAKNYLLDVSGNDASFIKLELIDVILDVMTTTSRQSMVEILQSISRTPTGKKRDDVEAIMEDTLLHAFDYIARERIHFHDVGYILNKMRALYMSSKSTDPRLLSLRKRIEKYAKQHSQLRASSALASVRTAVMLYFLLRALSANVYSS